MVWWRGYRGSEPYNRSLLHSPSPLSRMRECVVSDEAEDSITIENEATTDCGSMTMRNFIFRHAMRTEVVKSGGEYINLHMRSSTQPPPQKKNTYNDKNGRPQEGHDGISTPITPNSKAHPMHGCILDTREKREKNGKIGKVKQKKRGNNLRARRSMRFWM